MITQIAGVGGVEMLGGGAVRVGDFVASPLADSLYWGQGPIRSTIDYRASVHLAAQTAASLREVGVAQLGYTSCTGGRTPDRLFNGELVPARMQLAGGSLMTGLFVAETLGDAVFPDPTASVDDKIAVVAEKLMSAGIPPTAHTGCAAREGYVGIQDNVVNFGRSNRLFIARGFRVRNSELLGERFDSAVYERVLGITATRLDERGNQYLGYDPGRVMGVVREVTGDHGVNTLHSDGEGYHGHREQLVVRISSGAGNVAISGATLAEISGGGQVFGVNEDMLDLVAHALTDSDPGLMPVAVTSAELFTNAVHGTIAQGQRGYRIERAV